MCSFGGGGGPSAAEIAAQTAAQNARAASAQGVMQNVAPAVAAQVANMRRVRRYGIDNTVTGAGVEASSGLGVGVKRSLGM